jgi:hypothetical protein
MAARAARRAAGRSRRTRSGHGIMRERQGMTVILNEELAAYAALRALRDRGLSVLAVRMLATGTTAGDALVPGFASMMHGRLSGSPVELLSAAGVSASGRRRSRQPCPRCVSASIRARPGGLSLLRVDWMHLVSHAHDHPVRMSAGLDEGREPRGGRATFHQGLGRRGIQRHPSHPAMAAPCGAARDVRRYRRVLLAGKTTLGTALNRVLAVVARRAERARRGSGDPGQ